MPHVHRFVIYFNPQGVRGFSRWLNYSAKHGADLVYDDTRRSWFTDSDAHASEARRCGMLVATVEVVPA